MAKTPGYAPRDAPAVVGGAVGIDRAPSERLVRVDLGWGEGEGEGGARGAVRASEVQVRVRVRVRVGVSVSVRAGVRVGVHLEAQ